MPWISNAVKADFTSSNLKGLMIASIFFMALSARLSGCSDINNRAGSVNRNFCGNFCGPMICPRPPLPGMPPGIHCDRRLIKIPPTNSFNYTFQSYLTKISACDLMGVVAMMFEGGMRDDL
ncbi:MAG: hypothetical protein ABSE90_12395 [Verrucomicrobiota bacterium]